MLNSERRVSDDDEFEHVLHAAIDTKMTRASLLKIAAAAGFGAALSACGGEKVVSGGGSKPQALSTPPTTLFNPDIPAGRMPSLPRRIGISLPAGGELFTSFEASLRTAAEDFDLEVLSAQANGESTRQFQQTKTFLSRGVGALGAIDMAPPALRPLQLQAIEAGIPVFTSPTSHATCQLVQDQFATGSLQGTAAAKFFEREGGTGQAVIFNLDALPALKARSEGARTALKKAGVPVVADVASPQSRTESFKLTNTILQKNPGATIWIGNDNALSGVLPALKSAGKLSPSVGLFGCDGDAQALEEVAAGGPYKLTVGFNFPLMAYCWGAWTADWLDGKSIPLILDLAPFPLDSKAAISAFEEGTKNPAEAFRTNTASNYKWFKGLGNTSFSHNRYLTVTA